MGFFNKIRRHAAIAKGDFGTIFKDKGIPPLPAVANRLLAEINRPEPDIDQLVKLIGSTSDVSAKVIQTVNSTFFGLKMPVADVKHGVTLLGLRHIRSIALAYVTMDGIPKPKGDLFDHQAFWIDSLLQAIMARTLAKTKFPQQAEEAFTASLLADVALPVLLSIWQEYYGPVIKEWRQSQQRLSEIERRHFGWDHAQAGAWIVRSWEFPDEMIGCIGAHNLTFDQIAHNQLTDTIVVPMAVAALMPSMLRSEGDQAHDLVQAAFEWLGMTGNELCDCITDVQQSVHDILALFEFPDQDAVRILAEILEAAQNQGQEADS